MSVTHVLALFGGANPTRRMTPMCSAGLAGVSGCLPSFLCAQRTSPQAQRNMQSTPWMRHAQANAAHSLKYLTIPDAGTVFATATLIIDTMATSQLAVEPRVGTRADIVCAPPDAAHQPACRNLDARPEYSHVKSLSHRRSCPASHAAA